MATEPLTLPAEIAAAVERHLPAEAGTLLRKRLEKADQDAAALTQALQSRDAQKTLTAQWEARAGTAEAALAKHAALAEREAKVADAERALQVRQLQQELAAEKRISTTMVDVLGRLVRNVEYRSSVLGNETKNVVVPGSNETCGYTTTVTDTSNLTTEQKAE